MGAGFSPTVFHSKQRHSNSKPRLLFAGKLSYSKGCRELLRAVEPIGAQVSLELAGAGHGAEGDFIAKEARRQGARLLGRLSQTELADVMRVSDVFVLPSYYEGLPLVLAEALACGCRIVVNRLPGLEDWLWPELIDTGWVRLVDLPTLVETDQPSPAQIPEYVERLRRALLEQAENSEPPPSCLDEFLRASLGAASTEKSQGSTPGGRLIFNYPLQCPPRFSVERETEASKDTADTPSSIPSGSASWLRQSRFRIVESKLERDTPSSMSLKTGVN